MGKRILALILMAVMMLTMGAQAVDTFAVKGTQRIIQIGRMLRLLIQN